MRWLNLKKKKFEVHDLLKSTQVDNFGNPKLDSPAQHVHKNRICDSPVKCESPGLLKLTCASNSA